MNRKWNTIIALAVVVLMGAKQIHGQSANDVWVKQAASTGEDIGNCITVDNAGDILIAGRYANEFKFENFTVTSKGVKDIFIAKLDSNGVLKWMNYSSGPGNDRPYGLATDTFGNSILVGAVDSELAFSGTRLIATGGANNDFFIAKFGPHGNLLWAKNGGSHGFDQGYDVTIAADGDYLATGWFWGEAFFEENAVKSAGKSDVFIVKYSPAGKLRWIKTISSPAEIRAYGIAADKKGRFYVAGFTNGALKSGEQATTYDTTHASEIFLAAFENSGKALWLRTLGSYSSDRAFSVTVDPEGNPIVAGRFGSAIRQDGLVVKSTGAWDVIVAKYDRSGNLRWAKSYGGRSNDFAYDVNCDERGYIYLTGGFGNQANFGNFELKVNGQMDVFVVKCDSDGNVVWANALGGQDNDLGWSVAASASGSVYSTGQFRNASNFGKNNLRSRGSSDIFISKFSEPKLAGRISPVVVESALVTHEFEVSIVLDSVLNLYEARFELLFSRQDQIELTGDVQSSLLPGSFLGENPYLAAELLENNKGINVVIHGQSPTVGASGRGEIVKVKCRSLSTVPFDTDVQYTLRNLYAKDTAGNPIYLRAECDSIKFVGLPVWPGDTNNDQIVDEADLLRLGQFWGKNGYPRPQQDIIWNMKEAIPWQRLNMTYADANGDGSVNIGDLKAIGLNWKMKVDGTMPAFAGKRKPGLAQTNPAFLRLVAVFDPDKPNELVLELHAQQARDLFGLSFGLNYASLPGLKFLSVQPGELFQGDVLSFNKHDAGSKTVWLGLSRKAGAKGSNRDGIIARFLFQQEKHNNNIQTEKIELLQLEANSSTGNDIIVMQKKSTVESSAATEDATLPLAYALWQNSPNPFNPETTIRYSLRRSTNVLLTIHDTLGKHVRTLHAGFANAGSHSVTWDGKNEQGLPVASGFYLYKIKTPEFRKTMKMVLIR